MPNEASISLNIEWEKIAYVPKAAIKPANSLGKIMRYLKAFRASLRSLEFKRAVEKVLE